MQIEVGTSLIRFKRRILVIRLKQHIKCKNMRIEVRTGLMRLKSVSTGLIRLELVKTGLKEEYL